MLLAQLKQNLLAGEYPCRAHLHSEIRGCDGVKYDLDKPMTNLVKGVHSHVGSRGNYSEQIQYDDS